MSAVPPGVTVTGTKQRQAWIDRVLPPVEMVRPGLWSIPTPFPGSPLRYVLSYAVAYNGGVALIDTGWPAEQAWDGLLAGLGEAGWGIGDVKAVLITHGHGDHMGLARRVREASGAWVAMHEADAKPRFDFKNLGDFRRASGEALRRRGGLAADFSAAGREVGSDASIFKEFDLTVDRYLPDGQRPLGAGTGLVSIHTPGHTLGHVCFFDRDRNVLLTGDHILPRITPNISPAPGQTDDLLAMYLGSLRALSDLPAEEVLPAHEYRFRGLRTRIDGLLRHHEARLGEVMASVHDAPGLTTVAVARALKWSRPWEQMVGPQRRFAIGEAHSHLIYLQQAGYLANKGLAEDGAGVDSWYPLQDSGPRLA